MQFERLRNLTTLPAERLEMAFEHEHVITVLPVSETGSGEATVLVATPRKLGIATLRRLAGRSRWITRWAPWDAVRLIGRGASATDSNERGKARVSVDGKRFRSVLGGDVGRAALRDFARSTRRRHARLLSP